MTKGELERPRDRIRMLSIFAGAFLLRLLYLLESLRANPFFDAPVVDAQTYLDLASRIVAGDWLGGTAAFWQPPAFPYLLALFLGLFGDDVFVGVRLFHAVLGASSAVLVYRLARRAFDDAVATGAAAGTALYGPLIYFEGELLSVALEVFLYLALLLLLVRAMERDGLLDWGLAGGVAGLAAITRPNILLFVVVFSLLRIYHAPSQTRRLVVQRLVVAAVALAAVIAPVTLRNAAVGGEFVLISANGGVNFHIGNHARQDSMVAIHPGLQWERLVAEPLAAGSLTAGERSRYFFRKGIASIAADPLGWVQRLGSKSWQLIQGPEIKRNQPVYYARDHSMVLSGLLWEWGLAFPHGLIAPLILVGLGLSWRHRGAVPELLRTFLVCYAASILLFFVTSRYRVPMVPVAMIFAGLALQQLLLLARTSQWRRLWVAAVALVALLVACNLQTASRMEQDAQLQHDLGEVLLRKQQFVASTRHSQQALDLEPEYPSAWHNLAVAQLALGRPEQAETAARQALHQHPLRADTRIVLARALFHQRRSMEAGSQLARAAAQEPDNGDVRYASGRLLLRAGRKSEALLHLQAAARLSPEQYWVHYDLGRALDAVGQQDASLAAFEYAAGLEPERADAFSAAGAVALAAGDVDVARRFLERALSADGDYVQARINLGLVEVSSGNFTKGIELLQAVIGQASNPAPLWSAMARAYQAMGQTQKARSALEAARAK
jgi:tetratricopeptide (TPR) repeat protein